MGQSSSPESISERTRPEAPAEVLFFVHIPKCAGTTFRGLLRRWCGDGAIFTDSESRDALAERARIRPPRAVAGHFSYGLHEALPCRPLYVSLVRDPVDRFVSLYRHLRSVADHPFHPLAAAMDLERFYDHTLRDPRLRGQTVAIQCHFLARARTFEAARPVVDQAYAVLAPVEHSAEFASACAALLGQPPPHELPVRNAGARDDALAAARDRLADRIRGDHLQDELLYRHVIEAFQARRRIGPG